MFYLLTNSTSFNSIILSIEIDWMHLQKKKILCSTIVYGLAWFITFGSVKYTTQDTHNNNLKGRNLNRLMEFCMELIIIFMRAATRAHTINATCMHIIHFVYGRKTQLMISKGEENHFINRMHCHTKEYQLKSFIFFSVKWQLWKYFDFKM